MAKQMEARSQHWVSFSIAYCFLPYILYILSLNTEFIYSVRLAGQGAPGICLSPLSLLPQAMDYTCTQMYTTLLSFYMDDGALNSDSHVQLTKPLPQSQILVLRNRFSCSPDQLWTPYVTQADLELIFSLLPRTPQVLGLQVYATILDSANCF